MPTLFKKACSWQRVKDYGPGFAKSGTDRLDFPVCALTTMNRLPWSVPPPWSGALAESWTDLDAWNLLRLQPADVTAECRRMGGGFGGKETQGAHFAALGALASHHTGRPVKVWLNRDQDMTQTGRRHPIVADKRGRADRRLGAEDEICVLHHCRPFSGCYQNFGVPQTVLEVLSIPDFVSRRAPRAMIRRARTEKYDATNGFLIVVHGVSGYFVSSIGVASQHH